MSEAPPAEFDSYAGDYDAAINRGLKFTGETKEYFAETRIEWLKKRFREIHFTPKTCLDFGCGTGTSAPLLVSGLGLTEYLGYDPSSESITEAMKDHPEPCCSFIHEVSKLPKETVDLAFCNGVFHHIPIAARQQAFQHVYESLRPGGWFAFWENNKWNPIVHLIMSRVPFDRDAIMLFPGEAASQMKQAGFTIGLRDYLFVFPASLKALRFLEPALCKVPTGGQYLILAEKV